MYLCALIVYINETMKKTLLLLALVISSLSALAVPADRTVRRVRMTDGTDVMAVLHGDENCSWMSTVDGRVIELSEDGKTYKYSEETIAEVRKRAMRRPMNVRKIGSQASAPLPAQGSPKVPVILVQFTDSIFTVGSTPEEINHYYDLFCNGTRDGKRYTGHGSYGAVRDYFDAQSEGQFQPEFVVYGPVTLSKKENQYTSDNKAFATEAVQKATNIYGINWSDFDNKSKNQVDMVFIIFAGCGANTTGNRSNHIWPNEASIGDITLSDGTTKVHFICSGCTSEKRMGTNAKNQVFTRADGVGVMCHELSHALGLPDFYDTNYVAFGMDTWSLMDYGCYGANGGYAPCAYTAYERDFMGWRSLETLTDAGQVTLAPISSDGKGYKIVNDENPDEYYIIENRQAVGWDANLIRSTKAGLQVTHVDYTANSWNNNSVNTNPNHQRMTIIAANNRYLGTCTDVDWDGLLLTWTGNLYPYSYTDGEGVKHVNDSLTAYSTPAATVFTSSGFMNKDIHAIKVQSDKTVTLYFGNDYGSAIDGVTEDLKGKRSSGAWTDLSGRRLQGKPTKPGLYIAPEGKKVLIGN